jgi:cytochrome c oxidase subunit 2
MINTARVCGLIALAASVLLGVGAATAATNTTSVSVVASNFKFTPSTIEMHVGQSTTLRLISSGVHGLKSDDLGIPQTAMMPGQTTTVIVTPKKAGKYVLHCAIMCGTGHADMTLTVNVLP